MTTTATTTKSAPPIPERIKVLLLENVHKSAHEIFHAAASTSTMRSAALEGGRAASSAVAGVHLLGIRSKTHVTERVLADGAPTCSRSAASASAPTRSTSPRPTGAACRCSTRPSATRAASAEMIIAEIIVLARQLGDRSREVHAGKWRKVATGSLRGAAARRWASSATATSARSSACSPRRWACASSSTTSRPSSRWATTAPLPSLADAARASPTSSRSHVPATRETHDMIGAGRARADAARARTCSTRAAARVVEIPALAEALKSGHLAGAAIDVYPGGARDQRRTASSPTLQGLPNVDPHAAHRRLDRGGAGGDRPRGVATSLIAARHHRGHHAAR